MQHTVDKQNQQIKKIMKHPPLIQYLQINTFFAELDFYYYFIQFSQNTFDCSITFHSPGIINYTFCFLKTSSQIFFFYLAA